MTLLDNLCKVNNQQGGTIHQFLANNDWRNMDRFQKSYDEFIELGIKFPSKRSLEKLANQYHITIDWRK